MSVIPRANALALQGYRHCCHVMLHSPVEEKLFGFYPVKHAVLVSSLCRHAKSRSKPVHFDLVERSSCAPILKTLFKRKTRHLYMESSLENTRP